VTSFAELGLAPPLLAALAALGYEEPTAIQREAIPPLLAGKDLIGQAATGTGKTAAFALPLLQTTAGTPRAPGRCAALVLVPTRELAMQVAEAVHRYGREQGVVVLPIYGGQAYDQQLRALKRGVDVVVATPGRALDHVRRGTFQLAAVKFLVLDEADEMLDMGFADDIEALLGGMPTERMTALFSATIPERIAAIAAKHLRAPVRVKIAGEKAGKGSLPKVRQIAYVVGRAHKPAALGRVLDVESPTSAIVFCRMRTEVDELVGVLTARGYRAEALHGGLSQPQRDRVIARLRGEQADLVVATDVAARGLDIRQLSHVINYDVPAAVDDYVHRIGRTGRAGREGVAITLVEPREHRLLGNIEHATRQTIEVAALPTVADLRARRLQLVQAELAEALVAGGLEPFRGIVESLGAEHDVLDVAAAAVKLVHDASAPARAEEEVEIPTPRVPPPKGPKGPRPPRRKQDWQVARLEIGAGRRAGVRPADLVGALANEAGLEGWAIGAIVIGDHASSVEVPAEVADDLVAVLRKASLRGKKVSVTRLDDSRARPGGAARPGAGRAPRRGR
jgi:ATP-dependent RNA helicase DeaD